MKSRGWAGWLARSILACPSLETYIDPHGSELAPPAHSWAITRLARTDDKAVPSLPLDLAEEILTFLEVGIADLLEVVDN